MVTIQRNDLDSLFAALERRGYRIIGPTVRDDAIVLDTIHTSAELPRGWADEHAPGRYRLRKRKDEALFGHAVGPHSWKQVLFPPVETILRSRREGISKRSGTPGFTMEPEIDRASESPIALFGVRPCDLAAISRLDTVFLGGPYRAPVYGSRRTTALTIVAQCTQPGGTCFCSSLNTGPKATEGFDIALTELLLGDRHVFLAEAGR
jgi:hypothetical protein